MELPISGGLAWSNPQLHLRPGRISFSSDCRKQHLILLHLIMTLLQSLWWILHIFL